jgi:integrase
MTVPAVNRHLTRRMAEVKPISVDSERRMILSVWRWAYETGLVDSLPRGLVKIKVPRQPTKAWTLEQCCTAVKGTYLRGNTIRRTKVTEGQFLRCWILLGYESGARLGDLWEMRGSDFADGVVRWGQHKTGEPHVKVLSPACVKEVNEMLAHSPDGRVLGWVMRSGSARRRMQAYLSSLRLGGSSKWLRRSGATHIEMEHPGKGRLHLGHKTHGLAERCYIDWSQVRRDIPSVPTLLK